MPTVLITPEAMLHKPAPYVSALTAAGFDIRYPKNPTFTRGLGPESETIDELTDVVAVIAGGEILTAKVIAALPKLRVIARAGVGYDRVDIPAATKHKIPVTITPNANHEGVAEQAFAILLAVAKNIVSYDVKLRAGTWARELVRPIRGTTLGLFGMGRIGRSMAVRGLGMRMNVIATEMFPDQAFVKQHGIRLVDFDTLLRESDYLSVHCPLNAETRGLFNKDVFAKMKPGAVFLNTARGPLVVEKDLLAALKSGQVGAAGLDVFEEEPTPKDHPLFALDNVVVSPHIAGGDTLSMESMGVEAADSIIRLSRGEWPEGSVVNHELKAGWKW